MGPDLPPLDLEPLRGFSFACQPGCGLCCFTRPRATGAERATLITFDAGLHFDPAESGSFNLRDRPGGGGCELLSDLRCRGHAIRPSVCRRFPIHLHFGLRIQLSVILSCPGVALDALGSRPTDDAHAVGSGLEEELAAARRRIAQPEAIAAWQRARARTQKIRRLLERHGQWQEPDTTRSQWAAALDVPAREFYPAEPPPEAEEGLDFLPLFFDPEFGRIALAAHIGGWELLTLREQGGIERHLGVIPAPDRPPRLDPEADRLLRSYLAYYLSRDALYDMVAEELVAMADDTPMEAAIREELGATAATVVSRGFVRWRLSNQSTDPLPAAAVALGIRATDMDRLDRVGSGAPI